MDIMNSIALQSMSMSAAKLSQQYSISVQKKAMDIQETAINEILDNLPSPPKGQHIDVYA